MSKERLQALIDQLPESAYAAAESSLDSILQEYVGPSADWDDDADDIVGEPTAEEVAEWDRRDAQFDTDPNSYITLEEFRKQAKKRYAHLFQSIDQ